MTEVKERKRNPVARQKNSSSRKKTAYRKKRTLLGNADAATEAALAAAVRKNLNIEELVALCGSSASLDIARIELADTSADHVQIENLAMQVQCGSAMLHDVRAIIELNFTAHWEYDLKWLGSDSGVKPLGEKASTIELHDIALPMLEDFAFEIPAVEVEDVEVNIEPLTDLTLGGSEFEGLRVTRTDAPKDGFSVSNIDLGDLEITGIKVPATSSERVEIDRFSPMQAIKLPSVDLGPVTVPAISIDDVQSDGAVSVLGAQLESIAAPIFKIGDVFKIKLVVDPVLHLQIGSVVLSELEASASIETVSIRDIETEVSVSGVAMEELQLQEAEVDRIELA